jgi:hypothetical protein
MSRNLLQHYLFNLALNEEGIFTDFTLDHKNGWNIVNGKKFGIKYPKSYIKKIEELSKNKIYDYCFIGSWTDNKGRKEILEKYQNLNSRMYHSSNGRDPTTKFQFDQEYYQTISNSQFSLCPGHPAMPKHPNRWTYRFIESAFCRSIPVQFKETVYGDSFVRDIFYVWDDDLPGFNLDNYDDIVETNYQTALQYWTLQPEEIEILKGQQ